MALKIRRGTNGERTAGGGVVFAEGELIYTTDTDALYIGDGTTPGGILLATSGLGALSTYLTADNTAGVSGELELNKPLNLNNQNIVGVGNININGNITATGNIDIGDNTGDTVTITAQVDSDITPTQDSAFSLGAANKRWQNVYAAGLSVDGQIDAVSISANTVADNSTVMVNVATNTFTGNLNGNVTGNVAGNITGDVQGTLTGSVDGDVTGSVFADNSTTLVDGVAGVLRGDHYGSLFGSVKALNNGFTVLNPGTDGTNASFAGTVVGNVTGNVTGNINGDVSGNLIGFHTGDVKGSVFADNSTILVDAVAGTIPASVISGTITTDVSGNVSGTFTGNIFTNLLDSADSSEIVVTPALRTESDLTVGNSLIIGGGGVILRNDGTMTVNTLQVSTLTDSGGFGSIFVDTTLESSGNVTVGGTTRALQDLDVLWQGDDSGNSVKIRKFIGDPEIGITDPENPTDFDDYVTITNAKAEFYIPVKFVVVADDTARTALVSTPEKGMVILMVTGTAPAATNQLQFYNGTNWINV